MNEKHMRDNIFLIRVHSFLPCLMLDFVLDPTDSIFW